MRPNPSAAIKQWGMMSEHHKTILWHAAAAGGFFFILQRFAMGATVETALLWAAFFAAAGALLAWQQTRR